MENNKEADNNYISLAKAAEICNYSQEYLSLRARQGKLKAVKMGRNWFTTQEWLDEYVSKNAAEVKKEAKSALLATSGKKHGLLKDLSLEEAKKLAIFWNKKREKGFFAKTNKSDSGKFWLYIYNALQKDIITDIYALSRKLRSFYNSRFIPLAVLLRLKISGFWHYHFAFPAREYVFAGPPQSSLKKVLVLVLLNIIAFGVVAMAGFGELTFAEAQRSFENVMAGVGKAVVAVGSGDMETGKIKGIGARGALFVKARAFGVKEGFREVGLYLVSRADSPTGQDSRFQAKVAGREIAWQIKYAGIKIIEELSDTPRELSDMLKKWIIQAPDMAKGIASLPNDLIMGVWKIGERVANYDYRLRLADYQLRTADYGLRLADSGNKICSRLAAASKHLIIERAPQKIASAWSGFKFFVYRAVDTERQLNSFARKEAKEALVFDSEENWARRLYIFSKNEIFYVGSQLKLAKNNFNINFSAGISIIGKSYENSGKNIAVKWGEIEKKNEELKEYFDSGVYAIFYKAPKNFAGGIKEIEARVMSYNYRLWTTDYGLLTTDYGDGNRGGQISLIREATRSAPKNILDISRQAIGEIFNLQRNAKRNISQKVAAIESGLQSSIENLPEIVANGSQEAKDIIISVLGFAKGKAIAIWNWPFDQLRQKIIGEQKSEIVEEEAKQEEKELAEQKVVIQQKTQEVSKIVQPITEVTKKLITETKYETITAPEIAALNAKDESLQSQITKVSGELAILSGKFPVVAYAPINAPVNVGTSGFNVSGHSMMVTLGVSGDASIGRNLSVTNSTSLGNPNSAEDTFSIFSHSTFSAPVTIAS